MAPSLRVQQSFGHLTPPGGQFMYPINLFFFSLLGLSLCKLCRVRCFAKKQSDICHIESQKVFDSVIQDGLDTVSKTKKVVVMNIHMVPCNHHPNPNQIRVNKLPQTELTPNGAIMLQAKTCRQNLDLFPTFHLSFLICVFDCDQCCRPVK